MSSSKIAAWKQNLYRKSLITEKGEITTLARELIESLLSPFPKGDVFKRVRKESDDLFEQWWKAYPPTDALLYLNRAFPGSRGLRQKKEDCRKKFNDILLEGEYNAEDMIKALKTEILMKMNQSVKENENKMKYMQNTLTYLNQRTFENFMLPEGQQITRPVNQGATDI
jgi:hypothetical protein